MSLSPAEISRRAAEKYDRNTTLGVNDLERGIQEKGPLWKAKTMAAGPNYVAGVTLAITNGSYERGIDATPPEKFANSITPASKLKYTQNTSAARNLVGEVAARNTLISNNAMDIAGNRGLPGSAENMGRMTANATALHEEKLRRLGL